jgi:alkyl sulfatase BDS1-like metallo-beta-lactamase superfamily hydrolase
LSAERRPASEAIARANVAVREQLSFADQGDFEDARRGLVAGFSPGIVRDDDGKIVWDLDSYAFLERECPETANPSLWRQAQLNTIAGLFEIAPGFYQLRGLDLSNMHIVEGKEGIVVIDPLISAETAAAALALYREHRGDRPVTGLIYTHSHVDHFGGARGVVSGAEVDSGAVPVLAPVGFIEHAVSENVWAGTAMGRRAGYMYGAGLHRGPDGQIGAGLGMTTSTGRVTVIPPTLDVTETGQEEMLDGVRMVFQLTPGTEAPAEMNFHFPDHRVLCIAENATRNLHNTLTLRGALVRDPHVWASYLNESIELFGEDSDVLFAGHHWPCWGRERILDFLRKQRDLYGYLHDQTLRLLNKGYVGSEIAELIELPPTLASEWHCRGYYGSISHNAKAVYQRYMGWFDGNPAHLWEYPPEEAGRRYVEFMGGAEAALEKARDSYGKGDYRWVATVASQVVFADPGNREARELEADALEQMAYGAENATWRNFFLGGADELRGKVGETPTDAAPRDFVAHLTVGQLLDVMAIRVDGPRAWGEQVVMNWEFTDSGERYAVRLENAVLSHVAGKSDREAQVTMRMERSALDELLTEATPLAELLGSARITIEGDGLKLGLLMSLLDEPDPGFNIVLP